MKHLGETRSVRRHDHLLQTPDTFVRAPLPGMRNCTAVVHISRAGGAGFTQYTAEFSAGGELPPSVDGRFIYVIDGQLNIGDRSLGSGGYACLPASSEASIRAASEARAAVIEKPYLPLAGTTSPELLVGHEPDVTPTHLGDDPALDVRALVPENVAFDFAVNTMTYQPGAALAGVEMHVMEHGLLMLAGGGIYRLSDCWYPVSEGDFIWMAPYCPQWFGAIGKVPAKYLIYKDWNRHPR